MAPPLLPTGFNPVPGGEFLAGNLKGQKVAAFGMKATPVTNAEYGALAASLGQDRYVLLHHNWQTGETKFEKKGASIEEVAGGPVYSSYPVALNYDHGDIMIFGSAILIKMVDNPSAQFDKPGRIFSGADQPAVGLTYFHAKAWCLLKSLEDGGKYKYDLPTNLQYEYVFSDRGTKEYGTETGSLFKDGRKLVHDDQNGPTAAVNDPRYAQNLPFGIQTTGNVERWINFNPEFPRPGVIDDYGPYGLRGGSWFFLGKEYHSYGPHTKLDHVGFSPVVI